ncbi:MAG: molybdate ABC transporter permease subunit [Gammaproteobacteria bacterium]|nr:MAG: molybdate ABC transporter permease subunit [Gammaproteobacteria bacterium]
MDWEALLLSLRLAAWTTLLLLPLAILLARTLAWSRFPGRGLLEALVTLPLVLPPTVLGYYLLMALAPDSPLGRLLGGGLAFHFSGLVVASMVYSLPFAVQPLLRAMEGIPRELREAAWCCGLTPWQSLLRVELPLAWPGVLSAVVLSFAHTLGEFGVVLMVGGNIPGETRTLSIAIYDKVLAFEEAAAGRMALLLLGITLLALALMQWLDRRLRVRERGHG